MASCGDVSTHESLAATALLRELLPELKVRFVNVVDLFKLIAERDHPHGMSDEEFKAVFTDDKPVIFNFHSYPWLIHRLTYHRKGQQNLHVRGYMEKGNIDTPLELAIRNNTDRYSLAIAAIDKVQSLGNRGGHAREECQNKKIWAKNYAFHEGLDPQEITDWRWKF